MPRAKGTLSTLGRAGFFDRVCDELTATGEFMFVPRPKGITQEDLAREFAARQMRVRFHREGDGYRLESILSVSQHPTIDLSRVAETASKVGICIFEIPPGCVFLDSDKEAIHTHAVAFGAVVVISVESGKTVTVIRDRSKTPENTAERVQRRPNGRRRRRGE